VSVQDSFDILQKPWQGWWRDANKAFPIGAWQVEGTIVGDGTGGERQFNVFFRPLATGFQALAYSIERMSLSDSDNSSKAASFLTAGFDLNTAVAFRLETAPSFSAGRRDNLGRYFLGVASAAVGTVLLALEVPNADGATVTLRMEGYVWGQRSIIAEGGYQVPTTSPWSRS